MGGCCWKKVAVVCLLSVVCSIKSMEECFGQSQPIAIRGNNQTEKKIERCSKRNFSGVRDWTNGRMSSSPSFETAIWSPSMIKSEYMLEDETNFVSPQEISRNKKLLKSLLEKMKQSTGAAGDIGKFEEEMKIIESGIEKSGKTFWPVCKNIVNGAYMDSAQGQESPLLWAAKNIPLPLAQWIIMRLITYWGANTGMISKKSQNIVHILAKRVSDTQFDLLNNLVIVYQIDVSTQDGEGNTPAHVAAVQQNRNNLIYDLLLNGKNSSITNNQGKKPGELRTERDTILNQKRA